MMQELAQVEQVTFHGIFLDLKKAYDKVHCGRTLKIVEVYGCGPRLRGILKYFWDHQRIVACQAGYYGSPFEAANGLTQGGIASPTIFNVVCDAVVREWFHQLAQDGHGVDVLSMVKDILISFYADDGFLSARDPEWLQHAFDLLIPLFERVGLKTNATKTKAMNFVPAYIRTQISEEAYCKCTLNEGLSHRERQHCAVTCPHCDVQLQEGSLLNHLKRVHGLFCQQIITQPAAPAPSYRTSMPKTGGKTQCPVDRRGFGSSSQMRALRSPNHLQRPKPHPSLLHVLRGGAGAQAQSCGSPGLQARKGTVSTFKYLGRILSEDNNDWPAVLANVRKACAKWAMIRKVLVRDQTSPRVSGFFYKAVMQSVLLYGSETWVITDSLLRRLEAFHHKVARQITGQRARFCRATREWLAPPIADVLDRAGFLTIRECIMKRQTKVIEYISTKPLYQAATSAPGQSGSSTNRKFWWMTLEAGDD